MNIYEIKSRLVGSPHFFDRATMRFNGQTLKMFSVCKMSDGRYHVSASAYGSMTGIRRKVGVTARIFNPVTNEFEREFPVTA